MIQLNGSRQVVGENKVNKTLKLLKCRPIFYKLMSTLHHVSVDVLSNGKYFDEVKFSFFYRHRLSWTVSLSLCISLIIDSVPLQSYVMCMFHIYDFWLSFLVYARSNITSSEHHQNSNKRVRHTLTHCYFVRHFNIFHVTVESLTKLVKHNTFPLIWFLVSFFAINNTMLTVRKFKEKNCIRVKYWH